MKLRLSILLVSVAITTSVVAQTRRQEAPEVRPTPLEAVLSVTPQRNRTQVRIDAMVSALAAVDTLSYGEWELTWKEPPKRDGDALYHVVEARKNGNLVFYDAIRQHHRPPYLVRGGDPRDDNRVVTYHIQTRRNRDGQQVQIEVENAVENIEAATLLDLIHTIKVVTQDGTAPRIQARPGTVDTFWALTTDGVLTKSHATWSEVIDNDDADSVDSSSTNQYISTYLFSGDYYVDTGYFQFNTSGIPDGATISDVVLSLYMLPDSGTISRELRAYEFDWGSTLEVSDWASSAELGSATEVATADTTGWSTNAYNDFVETGTAFQTAINDTGNTSLVIAWDWVEDNSAPPSGSPFMEFATADTADTTNDPKLVVTHEGGGGGGGSILTIFQQHR